MSALLPIRIERAKNLLLRDGQIVPGAFAIDQQNPDLAITCRVKVDDSHAAALPAATASPSNFA
jgi:hypothetical protein